MKYIQNRFYLQSFHLENIYFKPSPFIQSTLKNIYVLWDMPLSTKKKKKLQSPPHTIRKYIVSKEPLWPQAGHLHNFNELKWKSFCYTKATKNKTQNQPGNAYFLLYVSVCVWLAYIRTKYIRIRVCLFDSNL